MPSWPRSEFPHLVDDNPIETSPAEGNYNCVAWAASDQTNWWWPSEDGYWPEFAPREETIEAFIAVFQGLGYAVCEDGDLEQGFEKIALYVTRSGGLVEPTHAARQLTDGRWTSKLGPFEDITHNTVDGVNGPVYGSVYRYLRRPR